MMKVSIQFCSQLLCLTASLVALQPAIGAKPKLDQDQPLVLEADRATFNDKTGITTYEGRVLIQQGTLKITADSIVVNLTPTRKILNVNAKGKPVRFEQQLPNIKTKSMGEANALIYDAEKSLILLTGKAKLQHNGANFTGETLRYSMSAGDIEAVGGKTGRVRLVIPPNTTRVDQSAKQH